MLLIYSTNNSCSAIEGVFAAVNEIFAVTSWQLEYVWNWKFIMSRNI